MKFLKLSAAALIFALPAFADSMSHGDHGAMSMGDASMEGTVHAKATINSIGDGTANVSHAPIPEIGWPAMTMDLAVAEGAQLPSDVTPGDEVTIMLVKGEDGMFSIGGIMSE